MRMEGNESAKGEILWDGGVEGSLTKYYSNCLDRLLLSQTFSGHDIISARIIQDSQFSPLQIPLHLRMTLCCISTITYKK